MKCFTDILSLVYRRIWTLTEDSSQPNGWLNEDLNVCTNCEELGFIPWLPIHVYGFEEDAAGLILLYLLHFTNCHHFSGSAPLPK